MKFKKTGFLLSLILISASSAFADWQSFQLTDNGYAESMSSTDLDQFDIPHFAWCSNDDGDYDIYYLSEITGTPVKVTDNITADRYPRLRIDQAGNAHIAFKGYDGHDYEEYYVKLLYLSGHGVKHFLCYSIRRSPHVRTETTL